MKYIYILTLLFCFSACKTPTFVEKKIVEFETGFPLLNSFSFGTWYDKKNKKEYIYFGNPYSGDAIVRFFTPDGKVQSEIEDVPLKNGVKGLANITSIFVYDIDTIVIVNGGAYASQMVYLNRKGERIQKIIVDSVFGQNERYRMLYCANQTPHKPFVYLHFYWNWVNAVDIPSSFKNELEYHKVYYKKHYETPSVCRWDVRANTYTFTAANMIPTYFFPQGDTSFNENTLILSEELHNCYAHKLFLWMRTSDKILVLNPDNLQIEHSFNISSKYSPIGIDPFPLKLRNQKLANVNLIGGRIIRILYDKNRNLYYVITKHELPEEDIAFSTEAPLSIHIYNTKFEKIKEQYLERGKYDYRFIFLTSQGLYISQNENNKDYDPAKRRFYFFEIEK
ncbi:MAG: hypothetical protein LBG80_17605 [Bacteroidales bacterium]|jgi:hypothetical protein|nr:hypothetical protein [Bacteroidales bacterium]